MDPALMRERQKFEKQRAASTETALQAAKLAKAAAKRNAAATAAAAPSARQQQQQQQNLSRAMPSAAAAAFHASVDLYHHNPNSHRFNTLSRIIRYMKSRHIDGDRHPLSLDEILEETKLEALPQSTKVWLGQEALPSNPKIIMREEDRRFTFKPAFPLGNGRRGRKDLLKLLRSYDEEGRGGIFKDDIEESLANVDEVIKQLGNKITVVARLNDKKVVLFYNEPSVQLTVDEEFKKQWRSCPVVDESQLEQHLSRQGIAAMDGQKPQFVPASRNRSSRGSKQRPVRLKDNEHLGDVLEDYSEKFEKKN